MTETVTTTTVNTTTATQAGIKLSVGTQTSTQTIGNFVSNVSLNPYMDQQIIGFYAFGLRPNSNVHAFFDSVLVDQYCAPGTLTGTDTSKYSSITLTATWGAPLVTDANGVLAGQFNVPAGMFKVGDRIFEIADVNNLAQGNAAISTSATASFTSSSLTVTKQLTTLTTVNPVLSTIAVSNTVVSTNTQVSVQTIPGSNVVNIVGYEIDPIAQALTINTPNSEAGLYATSLTLYFANKPVANNNGVTIYICETTNGYPDSSKIIPFSTTHLPWSNVSVSNTSTVGTTFTFESPVFLNNGLVYAFVVKPDNGDTNYWVYSAELGDFDIATGAQVYSQPASGTAFYGATAGEWTALQTEYIKFQLNIANFTSSVGNAFFNNVNEEYIVVNGIIYSNASVALLPDDIVYQSLNSTPSTAQTGLTSVLTEYNLSKNILYTINSTANSTFNYIANGFVQIHRFANVAVQSSPGPNTTTLIGYGSTVGFYNPLIDCLVPSISYITPAGTTFNIEYEGISNAFVADTKYNPLTIGTETSFYDQERILASYSEEQTNGVQSVKLHANLSSDSYLLSPAIDMVKMGGQAIGNQVDPVSYIYDEYYSNGTSKTKYISQIITLATGQDSQDLQVTITAHRPPATDVKIYARFLNGQDNEPISNKIWSPLLNLGYNVYCDPTNPNDVRSFVYTTSPAFPMFSTNGTITIANTSSNVVGTNTAFGTDVSVGYWINMLANSTFSEQSRQIVSITNSTFMTLNAPFNGNYTGQPYFVATPPGAAWQASNTVYQLGAANGMVAYGNGAPVATVSTNNNIITGSNTNFTALLPGQVINVNGYNQAIVSITNSTSLTVGAPWPVTVSGANAYIETQAGLTYLNSNNALFTTYKQFQIKMILQSNNSQTVPIINDLTALALQL